MKRLIGVGLGLWIAVVVVVGGLLLAPHLVALPAPAATDVGLRAALKSELPTDRWSVAHIMYRSCACSRRTIAHLVTRLRPANLDETVIMVDDHGVAGPEDRALLAAGFRVTVITPTTLRERFHVEAVPLLAVVRPDGELAYVGGYNRRKQSRAYEDLAIIEDLRTQTARASLPIFGCATTERLASALDPLGLRR